MSGSSCATQAKGLSNGNQVFEYNTPVPIRLQARGLSDIYRKSFPVALYTICFAVQIVGIEANNVRIIFPTLRVLSYLGSLPKMWYQELASPTWTIFNFQFTTVCNAVTLQGALPFDNGDAGSSQDLGVSFSFSGWVDK